MKKIIFAIIAVIVLSAAWYLFSPLIITKTIDDAFPEVTMDEAMPEAEQSATRVSTGVFQGTDDFHVGSGSVSLYTLMNEERLLRFENFSVTNGPDLRVLLTRHPNPQTTEDLDEGYIELGKLKGNKGNQNYEVSDAIDTTLYPGVVIYCKPFHVIFSKATLE